MLTSCGRNFRALCGRSSISTSQVRLTTTPSVVRPFRLLLLNAAETAERVPCCLAFPRELSLCAKM
jgi:hypothetical protein